MTPEPVDDLVVVTVASDLPQDLVPDWVSSGAIYRAREVAEWVTIHSDEFDVVATGSVGMWPAVGDPLPIYEIQRID